MSFVHLRLHSEFSLVDSLVRVGDVVKACQKAEMPALALTDLSNLYGLVKFYKAAQSKGVKPIFGADLWVAEGAEVYLVTVLAMNETGYFNLIHIVSKGFIDGQQLGKPIVQRAWLEAVNDGLIVLLGKHSHIGALLLGSDSSLAIPVLNHWLAAFPDRLYLELQRTSRAGDEAFVHAAVNLATPCDCPVVATNDVRFLNSA